MQEPRVCNSTEHLFLPILEVHDPLLRCVHCNVFAYQETVKQLAKTRAYGSDEAAYVDVETIWHVNRLWSIILRGLSSFLWRRFPSSHPRTAD